MAETKTYGNKDFEIRRPKADLSLLALTKQKKQDKEDYEKQAAERDKKRGLRGWLTSATGVGGALLGGLALNAMFPGAGYIMAGLAAGGGSLLGQVTGRELSKATGWLDPDKVSLGQGTSVLTGKKIGRMSDYGTKRWSDENQMWREGEAQNILTSSALTGITAGIGAKLKGAEAFGKTSTLTPEQAKAVKLANTDPNLIKGADPASKNFVSNEFASKYASVNPSQPIQPSVSVDTSTLNNYFSNRPTSDRSLFDMLRSGFELRRY